MVKRAVLLLLGLGALLALLALASWLTTNYCAIGGFPPGEWEFFVHDVEGSPIAGARLNIFGRGRDVTKSGSPLGAPVGDEPVTNSNGLLRFVNQDGGGRFGEHGWLLFWVFKISEGGEPEYKLRFIAHGYRPATLSSKEVLWGEGRIPVLLTPAGEREQVPG